MNRLLEFIEVPQRRYEVPYADPDVLRSDEQLALLQLCSTAHLAVRRLDEEACRRLMLRGLVAPDSAGYWRVTREGQSHCAGMAGGRRGW